MLSSDLNFNANVKRDFLRLVRLGIGHSAEPLGEPIDWNAIEALAAKQGLLGVVLDGEEVLSTNVNLNHNLNMPDKLFRLEWLGKVMLEEERFAMQKKASVEMADLFASNGIRTYVLKGMVVSECYPKPQHRVSSDVDCFLLPDKGDADVWEKGNRLMEEAGYKVGRGFYKNSSFSLPGLTVENHRFMVPFRGNKRLKNLEKCLQAQFKNGSGGLSGSRIEGTELWRPPVMVSALFLIEHAYSHFLHEGLTWRHVLDWMMFSRKHKEEIDWPSLDVMIDEFGFRKFYDSYNRLGQYLVGEIQDSSFTFQDRRMLEDVWAPLDLQEDLHSLKAKIGMARATVRAGRKYRYFAEISMLQALLIQVKGFFFIKNPQLT